LTYGERRADLVPYTLGGFLVFTALATPLFARIMLRLARLRRLLRAGTPAGSLPVDDIVEVLRLPVHVFVIVLGQFSLCLLAAPLVQAWWLPNLLAAKTQVYVGSVAFGLITATTLFYALTNLVRTRIAPVLLVDGSLAHLGPRWLVRVAHHMLLLAATLGIAWPALLYLLVVDADRPSLVGTGLMIVVALTLFFFQMISALRTVSFGVGHLVERMQVVKSGDLTTRAEVRGLDTLGELASSFNAMVLGLVQREQLKETFGRYVTQQVADEILAGRVALGGELRTATVLFSDIRDFTKMSEQLSPVDVVAFLNEYLGAMVDSACSTSSSATPLWRSGRRHSWPGTSTRRRPASRRWRSARRCSRCAASCRRSSACAGSCRASTRAWASPPARSWSARSAGPRPRAIPS